MRQGIKILFLMHISSIIYSQVPFLTTWNTSNPGGPNNYTITIPTTGGGYNYDVDWENDGVYDDFGVAGNITHSYASPGIYQVAIRGSFPRIRFTNAAVSHRKIISIDQWGDVQWTSMSGAFTQCYFLSYSAIDSPNLSMCTSLESMFGSCQILNGDLSNWDVSTITNMRAMFSECFAFNGNISNWNVSNVTSMEQMFADSGFNQDISGWNVGNVTNMRAMFSYNTAFNQNINNWNVSKVTRFDQMFDGASSFNQSLDNWNTSKVTNMALMFRNATSFNQDISNWSTVLVTNMNQMFNGATSFNQDLGSFRIRGSLTFMLQNSGIDCANYSASLIGWNTNFPTLSNINLGAQGRLYGTNAISARNDLLAKNWTFVGDGPSGTVCSIVLPIIYSSELQIVKRNENNILSWSIAQQINNDRFEIEHSQDGRIFVTMGEIEGAGNISEVIDYEYTHRNPPHGVNYYRIKQVDFDGRYEYSHIVSVRNNNSSEELNILSNMVSDYLTVAMPKSSHVWITNAMGQVIIDHHLEAGNNTIEVSHLSNGLYYIKNEQHQVAKFVKI